MSAPSRPSAAAAGHRRRTGARLAAVQALYQIEVAGAAPETVVAEFLHHRLGRAAEEEGHGAGDPAFFTALVRGASAQRDALDPLISAALTPDWPLARLEAVLRAILRMGAFELVAQPDVPATVVISEYLDIAHAFFAGKEPGLVNGVLDRLAETHRPAERAGRQRGGTAT